MAAVTTPGGGDISGWAERNNAQASRLLNLMDVAKPVQHMSAPTLPPIGGDHPKPQGMFVEFLFGPGPFVWPIDSETQLAKDADTLRQQQKFHEDKADEAKSSADRVFNNYWTAGEGTEAAGKLATDLPRLYATLQKCGITPSVPIRHFELLMRVNTMAGAPNNSDVVACHILPGVPAQRP